MDSRTVDGHIHLQPSMIVNQFLAFALEPYRTSLTCRISLSAGSAPSCVPVHNQIREGMCAPMLQNGEKRCIPGGQLVARP